MNETDTSRGGYAEIARNGLWHENPAIVQLLGLCPLLAVSGTVVNSITLGLCTLVILAASNLVISAIRSLLDDTTRLPAQIMVIATFVTLADLLLQAHAFEIHQQVGLFVALIVTNCTLLGRAESFARRNPVRRATFDGAMMGTGFLIVIVLMGMIREVLGHGTLFTNMDLIFGSAAADWTITVADSGFLLVVLPPGAFLTLGLLVAGKNWVDQRNDGRMTDEQG